MSQSNVAELLDFGSQDDYAVEESLGCPELHSGLLVVDSKMLTELSRLMAIRAAFYFPKMQLAGFSRILKSPESSHADRFVAQSMIKNAVVACEGLLPLCQDTGTMLVYGWLGDKMQCQNAEAAIAQGLSAAWQQKGLRASQLGPVDFIGEKNTKDNLPASIEMRQCPGHTLRLVFSAKGGGSANLTHFSMESPALLREEVLAKKIHDMVIALGSSGCPPYRISIVMGGVTPEHNLFLLSLAGMGLLDSLPEKQQGDGSPLRSRQWEGFVLDAARQSPWGAQFGGSAHALDARVIRASRHAASLPFSLGIVCSAHRTLKAFIDKDGVHCEIPEMSPQRYLSADVEVLESPVAVDLDLGLDSALKQLRALPRMSFVLLSGTVYTARDAVHRELSHMLDTCQQLPEWAYAGALLYAGPLESPLGLASGSFGPTTSKRMDAYMEALCSKGIGLVTIGKGDRSHSACESIARNDGVYLAALGGVAALNAREHVAESVVVDFAHLGMEAVRRVRVVNLPVMVLVNRSIMSGK